MKKMNFKTAVLPGASWLVVAASFLGSCQKAIEPLLKGTEKTAMQADMSSQKKGNDDDNKKVGHFNEVNLTANNNEYGAPNIDPSLINAWGLVFNPNGTPWISSQGGHVSNVYNSEGVPRVPINPVTIPSPGSSAGGNPTGIVFNANANDFI
ncbi:MAG: hypothetical protein M3Y85_11790, partial [Bacteroidota bacterium]|nr:hypothetical protein [Bacteroidota bacterium]